MQECSTGTSESLIDSSNNVVIDFHLGLYLLTESEKTTLTRTLLLASYGTDDSEADNNGHPNLEGRFLIELPLYSRCESCLIFGVILTSPIRIQSGY